MKLWAEKRIPGATGRQRVLRRGRLMARLGWMPYRGIIVGERADPCDRLRLLAYRAHLVVSWLPASTVCGDKGHRLDPAWDHCSRCGKTGLEIAMKGMPHTGVGDYWAGPPEHHEVYDAAREAIRTGDTDALVDLLHACRYGRGCGRKDCPNGCPGLFDLPRE